MSEEMFCRVCGKRLDRENYTASQWSSKRRQWKHGGTYCSRECSSEYCRKISSETMSKTNKKYASERMKKNNPMKREDVREKVSKRLKEIGHCPKIRCGNGAGLTVPQQTLLLALTEIGPYAEYAIPTKYAEKYETPYPDSYKVDIAIPSQMVAIEVDGNSHCALKRKEQDGKKEYCLNTLGWRVLRFKNEQVMEHLEDCVQTVMSIISK